MLRQNGAYGCTWCMDNMMKMISIEFTSLTDAGFCPNITHSMSIFLGQTPNDLALCQM